MGQALCAADQARHVGQHRGGAKFQLEAPLAQTHHRDWPPSAAPSPPARAGQASDDGSAGTAFLGEGIQRKMTQLLALPIEVPAQQRAAFAPLATDTGLEILQIAALLNFAAVLDIVGRLRPERARARPGHSRRSQRGSRGLMPPFGSRFHVNRQGGIAPPDRQQPLPQAFGTGIESISHRNHLVRVHTCSTGGVRRSPQQAFREPGERAFSAMSNNP